MNRAMAVCVVGLIVGNLLPTLAATLYVDQNNATPPVPYQDFTDWDRAATNIQDAVTEALNNGLVNATIRIRPGTYRRNVGDQVVLITRSISLIGEGDRNDIIIDGQNVRRGIYVNQPPGPVLVRIEGLTVTNGNSVGGIAGGVYLYHNNAVAGTSVVENCVIGGNTASGANAGAGIGVYATVGKGFCLRVTNSEIVGNRSTYNGVNRGGGMCVISARLLMDNCRVADNETTVGYNGTGGGLHISGAITGSVIRNCWFERNTAWSGTGAGDGGGIYSAGNGAFLIEGTVFEHNTAHSSGSTGFGGALYIDRTDDTGGNGRALFVNTTFEHNSSVSGGGAVNISVSAGGVANATFRNCLFAHNAGGYGSAVNNRKGSVYFENCTVASNAPSAGPPNGALYQYMAGSFMSVSNSIVYHNQGGDRYLIAPGTAVWGYSCTPAPQVVGDGIVTGEPRFVDRAGGDFHLQPDSPCVDKGNEQPWMSASVELAGRPRLSPNGKVDMGAFENHPHGTAILIR